MGIVYEAIDERLQRPVAIKAILPASDPQMRDRLRREARTAAAVSHPHIWAQVSDGLGERQSALDLLSRAVDTRFHCVRGFEGSPLLSALRPLPAFHAILERASHRQAVAAKAFADADGPRLLGLPFEGH